ncbi:MAG: hypothetical protein ACR2L6_01740 [Gemmatimonadaceae bacterium]
MTAKTTQLQLRLTPEQKRAIKRLAQDERKDMSALVLERVLPDEAARFQAFAARLADGDTRKFVLAELEDYLRSLPAGAFTRAVRDAPQVRLDRSTLNSLAAAIELAAARRGVPLPEWTRPVSPSQLPVFGSRLTSVRLYLLAYAPAALRRRNIFADSSLDERV